MRRSADLAPEYYERLPMARPFRLTLWAAAATFGAGALVLAVGGAGTTAASLGAGFLGTAAAITGVAAYRLAACEIRTTKAALHFGFGPLSAAYPLWGVLPERTRPASSWRRKFADHEVVVRLQDPRGIRRVFVPTRQPDDLTAALAPPDASHSHG